CMPFIVVDHPLVAHRIARLRNRDTEPSEFRDLARQLAMFLAYEAFRDLATNAAPVTTPLDVVAEGRRLSEPGPLLLPILRAALGEGLNERAFIVPGLGDAGDRLFGPA